jgi:hypothetical protein
MNLGFGGVFMLKWELGLMQLLDGFQMRFWGGFCPRTEVQGYTILDAIPVNSKKIN